MLADAVLADSSLLFPRPRLHPTTYLTLPGLVILNIIIMNYDREATFNERFLTRAARSVPGDPDGKFAADLRTSDKHRIIVSGVHPSMRDKTPYSPFVQRSPRKDLK